MTSGVRAARPVTPVSILAATLEQLVDRLEGGAVLGTESGAELRLARDLAVGLDPYLKRWTTPESSALATLADATRAEPWSGALEQEMLSGHVEGQLLKMLVHTTGARQVLEVGMFTGYSALAMAEALPADGQLVACELDAEVAAFAQRRFDATDCGRKITVRLGPAQATIKALAEDGRSFELIFIDADKAGYLDYVRAILDGGLLDRHGLICVDNTLMQGQPWLTGEPTANGRAIAEFNQAIAADPRIEQVIIPVRDGMTLIRCVES